MASRFKARHLQRLHQRLAFESSSGIGISIAAPHEENKFWDDYCKLATNDERPNGLVRSSLSLFGIGLSGWPQLTETEEDDFWKSFLLRSTSFVIVIHGVNIIFLAAIIVLLANYEARPFSEEMDYYTTTLSRSMHTPGRAVLFADLVIWLTVSTICIATMVILRSIPQGSWSPTSTRDDLLSSLVSALLQTERPPTRGSWIKDITGREIWKAVGNVILLLRTLLLLVRLIGGWNHLLKGNCGYDDWVVAHASESVSHGVVNGVQFSAFIFSFAIAQTCIDVAQVCVFSTVPFPLPWAPLFCVVEVSSQIIRLLSCSSILFHSGASTALSGKALSIIIIVYFVAAASAVVNEFSLKNFSRNNAYFENINREKKRVVDLLCLELKTPLQMAADAVVIHEREIMSGLQKVGTTSSAAATVSATAAAAFGGLGVFAGASDVMNMNSDLLREVFFRSDEDGALIRVRGAVQQLRRQIRIVTLLSDNLLFLTRAEEGRLNFAAAERQQLDFGEVVGQVLLLHADQLLDKNPLGINLKHLMTDDEPLLNSFAEEVLRKKEPLAAQDTSHLFDILESRLLIHPGRNLITPGETTLLIESSLLSIVLRDLIYFGLEMLNDLEQLCATVEAVAKLEGDDSEVKRLAVAFKGIARRGPIIEMASSAASLSGRDSAPPTPRTPLPAQQPEGNPSASTKRSPLLVLGIAIQPKEKRRGSCFPFGFNVGGTEAGMRRSSGEEEQECSDFSSQSDGRGGLRPEPSKLEISVQCAPLNRALLLLDSFLSRRGPVGFMESCWNILRKYTGFGGTGTGTGTGDLRVPPQASSQSNRTNSSMNMSQASEDGPNASMYPPLDLELDDEGVERDGKYMSIVRACEALCSRAGGTFAMTPSSVSISIPCSLVSNNSQAAKPAQQNGNTALRTPSNLLEQRPILGIRGRHGRGEIAEEDSLSRSSTDTGHGTPQASGAMIQENEQKIKFFGACVISASGKENSTPVPSMRGLVEALDIGAYDIITFGDSTGSQTSSQAEHRLTFSGRKHGAKVNEVSGGSSDSDLLCNDAGLLLGRYDLCFVGSLSRCKQLRHIGYAGRIVLVFGGSIYSDRTVIDGDIGSYIVSIPFFEVDVELVRRWLLKTESISTSLFAEISIDGEHSAGNVPLRSSLSRKIKRSARITFHLVSPCCYDSAVARVCRVVCDELSGSLFVVLLSSLYHYAVYWYVRFSEFLGDTTAKTRKVHLLAGSRFALTKMPFFGVRRFNNPHVEASFYKWRVTNPSRAYSHHAFLLDCTTVLQLLVVFVNAAITEVLPKYRSGDCHRNSCLSPVVEQFVIQIAWFFILFRRSIERFLLRPMGIYLRTLAVIYSMINILGQAYHTPDYFWDRGSPKTNYGITNHDSGKPWVLNLPSGNTTTSFDAFASAEFGNRWKGKDILYVAMLLPAANIILWTVYQPWPYSFILATVFACGSGSIIAVLLNYVIHDSYIVSIIFVAHLLFQVTAIMALGHFEYFHRKEYQAIRQVHASTLFMSHCLDTAQKDLRRPLRIILAKKRQILEALADCYTRRSSYRSPTIPDSRFTSKTNLSTGISISSSSWLPLASRKQNFPVARNQISSPRRFDVGGTTGSSTGTGTTPSDGQNHGDDGCVFTGSTGNLLVLPKKLFTLMKALKTFHRSLLFLHELRFEFAFKQSMTRSISGPPSALPEAASLSRGLLLNRLIVGIASKFTTFDTDMENTTSSTLDPEDVPIKVFTSVDPRLTIVKADEDALRCLLVYALRRATEHIKEAIRKNRKSRKKSRGLSRGPLVNGRIIEAVQEIAVRVRPLEESDKRSFFDQRFMVVEVLDTAFVDEEDWDAKLRAVQQPDSDLEAAATTDKSFAGQVCSDLVDVLTSSYKPQPPESVQPDTSSLRDGSSLRSSSLIKPRIPRPVPTQEISLKYETHHLRDDNPAYYGYATLQRYCFPFKLDYRSITAEVLMRKVVPERNKTMRLAQSLIRGDRKATALGLQLEVQAEVEESSADTEESKLPLRQGEPLATKRVAIVINPLSASEKVGATRADGLSNSTSDRITLSGGWHVETVPNLLRARKLMKSMQVDCVFVIGDSLVSTETLMEAQARLDDVEIIPLLSRSPNEVGIVTALRMVGFDMVIARVRGDSDEDASDDDDDVENTHAFRVLAKSRKRRPRQQRIGDMDVHDFDIVVSRLELAMPDAPMILARVCDKKAVDCLFLREEN